jgi:hypothetical protein
MTVRKAEQIWFGLSLNEFGSRGASMFVRDISPCRRKQVPCGIEIERREVEVGQLFAAAFACEIIP